MWRLARSRGTMGLSNLLRMCEFMESVASMVGAMGALISFRERSRSVGVAPWHGDTGSHCVALRSVKWPGGCQSDMVGQGQFVV